MRARRRRGGPIGALLLEWWVAAPGSGCWVEVEGAARAAEGELGSIAPGPEVGGAGPEAGPLRVWGDAAGPDGSDDYLWAGGWFGD